MYIHTILTSKQNYANNPFVERIGYNLILAKNSEDVLWVNWKLVPNLEYLGHLTEDETRIQIRTNPDIACRRPGQFPLQLIEYFNLNY